MTLFRRSSDPAMHALDMGMTGKEADMATKLWASVLVKRQPFLGIPFTSLDHLARMVKSADMAGYYLCKGDFNICAFFKHDDYFPIARSYYVQRKTRDDFEADLKYLKENGVELRQLGDMEISFIASHHGYEKRIDSFFERIKSKSKSFQDLFDGRLKSTTTKSAMFFASDGCVICGAKDSQMFSTTVAGNNGVLFGFHLCDKHSEECKKANSNLEFLSAAFGVAPPIHVAPMPRSEVVATSSKMLIEEFGCRMDKVESDAVTVFRIASGFKIVCRLTSETDYAYMIFRPDREKEVARIDSARHHSIAYGPDHVHRNVKKKKQESPVSSFTTGYPVIDKVALRALLEEKEREYFLEISMRQ